MTRVVDTADDHAALALFDDRDRCVLDLERKEAAARPADNTMQRDLNHPAVRDDHNVTVQNTILQVESSVFAYLSTRALRDALPLPQAGSLASRGWRR